MQDIYLNNQHHNIIFSYLHIISIVKFDTDHRIHMCHVEHYKSKEYQDPKHIEIFLKLIFLSFQLNNINQNKCILDLELLMFVNLNTASYTADYCWHNQIKNFLD